MGILAENRRAFSEYDVLEKYEAGLELLGTEVKSAKSGRINIAGSYAVLKGGEVRLINADIPPYQPKNAPPDYDARRPRRLLLKKEEIKRFFGKTKEGLTLIPLRVYTKGPKVKLELGLGRRRKKADKREAIRKREAEREARRIGGVGL